VQPLLQWKSITYTCNIFWVCICSLRYQACNAHAPYCHVACPALQYFSTFSHKWHDFKKIKKVTEQKSLVWLYPQIWFDYIDKFDLIVSTNLVWLYRQIWFDYIDKFGLIVSTNLVWLYRKIWFHCIYKSGLIVSTNWFDCIYKFGLIISTN